MHFRVRSCICWANPLPRTALAKCINDQPFSTEIKCLIHAGMRTHAWRAQKGCVVVVLVLVLVLVLAIESHRFRLRLRIYYFRTSVLENINSTIVLLTVLYYYDWAV